MRFSGHESFPIRYAWLPKAYRALGEEQLGLSGDEGAMVELGIGKNMVRAIRFWVQATGVAEACVSGGYQPTLFGRTVLGEDGLDPFLEDARTLWLLHWRICQNASDPLFAWDYLINRWHFPDFSPSALLPFMSREAEVHSGRALSPRTLGQHLDVFIRTYVPAGTSDVVEDSLDSPLAELDFIRAIGERSVGDGAKRETVYAFDRDLKPGITSGLFVYCLLDFWRLRHPTEQSLSFREIAVGHGGPGQVFKLSEEDLRRRLDTIAADSGSILAFRESAAEAHLVRTVSTPDDWWQEAELLRAVYPAAPWLARRGHA